MKNYVFVLTLLLVLCPVFVVSLQAQGGAWDVPEWTEEADGEAEEAESEEAEAVEEPAVETAEAAKTEKPFIGSELMQGIVVSADAVLVCWAIYAFFDFKSGEAAYDKRYSALDPALYDTDETLARLKDEKDAKGLVSGVAAGIAAAAIAYTVLDYLQLHIVFPAEVKAAALPGGFVMTAQIEF